MITNKNKSRRQTKAWKSYYSK